MATGAYDANGIWQYGEDDNIALFSDLLKLGTESTSSAFTADRARLATLEAGSLAGIIPVAPTSVDKSGGTSSVTGLGAVTFTGVTSISLNGVFTDAYKNYKLLIEIYGSVTNSTAVKLRASGTDSPATNGYSQSGWQSTASTVSSYNSSAINYWLMSENYGGSIPTFITADIYGPKLSVAKEVNWQAAGVPGGAHKAFGVGGYCGYATPYDGLTLLGTAGTITGVIQCFGYND